MGYTTYFRGGFEFNKKLDKETLEFLVKLSTTRRMKRNVDVKYGVEGEFYVDGTGFAGQDQDNTIVDYNEPPVTQPSLWCQWTPTEDGGMLVWDGGEKFYSYVEWLQYIITKVLTPRQYILNGSVDYQGEDRWDFGTILINDNVIHCIAKE